MITTHYDFAIIGSSLAAQISATLLAKQGNKVLFLTDAEEHISNWFHSSLFLEQLLAVLGARSCFVEQNPIQVISEKSRITIDHEIPLESELTREFGEAAFKLIDWLKELQQTGQKLEALLWQNGGFPLHSLKDSLLFNLFSCRKQVTLSKLEKPLSGQIMNFPSPVQRFLTDLFQGLSLVNVDQLTYARASILWAQVLKPENLKQSDFSLVLKKRFEQFHGTKLPLENLQNLEFDNLTCTGGLLKSGVQFKSNYFLLGKTCLSDLFMEDLHYSPPEPFHSSKWITSDLKGPISKLLKKRIVCGGETPLKLAIEEQDSLLLGTIRCPTSLNEETIRKQLEPVLPFSKYTLNLCDPSGDSRPSQYLGELFKFKSLPIKLSRNLYCADNQVLVPEMGVAGAAILAWTFFNKLGSKTNAIDK